MIPFDYDPDGHLCAVGEPFVALREPSKPIPAEITRITGLTDGAVAGQILDPDQVAAFIAPAVIVLAHNAAFDRPFAERLTEAFKPKGWACSMSQVDWRGRGWRARNCPISPASVDCSSTATAPRTTPWPAWRS